MEHKLINTEDYLLIVDDSEIKDGEWVYVIDENFLARYFYNLNSNYKKIISHLPLNNSPILEGVDLLPPIEDEVEKLADEHISQFQVFTSEYHNKNDFIAGYNKSKEKYIDVIKHIESLCDNQNETHETIWRICYESLQQPKMPVGFKCEIELCEESCKHNWCKHRGCQNPIRGDSIVTTTNSQSITQWVGEYIY